MNGAVATVESSRGGGSLIGAARSGLVLNKMTPEEAKAAGIDNPKRFFQAYDDKPSRAAAADQGDWYQIISVPLGNGTATRPGDEIGVAVPWTMPDAFEGLTGDHLLRCQLAISEGIWRENHQATEWAGKAIASVLSLDIDDKADRARILKLIKTWLREGALVVVDGTDTRRKPCKFIEVGRWQNDQSAPLNLGGAERGGAAERNTRSTTPPPRRGGGGGAGSAGRISQVEQTTPSDPFEETDND